MIAPSLVLNLAIVAILLIFLMIGWRRGLVFSLCSLLAIFVSFFGAKIIADTFSPTVGAWLTPQIAIHIQEALTQHPELAESGLDALLQGAGLPGSLASLVQNQVGTGDGASLVAQVVSQEVSRILAFGGLYLISFFVLLFLWRIISHALNLVVRLPVLNFCNRSLGGLFGLVKGVLVLCVVGWALCDLTGLVSPDLLKQTWLLQGLSGLFHHAVL